MSAAAACVRVGVTSNKGAKRPQAEAVGALPRPVDFGQLFKFCKSKLKLKSGSTRIFVCRGSPARPAGFEIVDAICQEELNAILVDGVLLAVSAKGADYNNAGRATGDALRRQLDAGAQCLALPPRSLALWLRARSGGPPCCPADDCAVPGSVDGDAEEAAPTAADAVDSAAAAAAPSRPAAERAALAARFSERASALAARERLGAGPSAPPLREVKVRGLFPHFPRGANVLQVLRAACPPSQQFVERFEPVKDTAGLVVFDYAGDPRPPAFLDPFGGSPCPAESMERAVQREARGLVLCAETGAVLARRFHKFFNLNERPETVFPPGEARERLEGGVCKEKLDGCLCSPAMVGAQEQLVWCTRRVRSAEVEAFLAEDDAGASADYGRLARYFLGELNATPLFEWCPGTHVVGVLRHERSRLVLISVRCNSTGEYLDSPELDCFVAARFPGVEQARTLGTAGGLMRACRHWTGVEGVVIALPDGARYKLKSDWYVDMARASKEAQGGTSFLPKLLRNGRRAREGAKEAGRAAKDAGEPSGAVEEQGGDRSASAVGGADSSGVRLRDVPAEHVWLAILSALERPDLLDDFVANCASELGEEDGEREVFLEFVRLVELGADVLLQDFWAWAQDSFRAAQSAEVVAAFADHWRPPTAWVEAAGSGASADGAHPVAHGDNANGTTAKDEPAIFAWPTDLTRTAVCCRSLAFEDSSAMRRQLRVLLSGLAKRGDVGTLEALLGVQWRCGPAERLVPADRALPAQFGSLDPCPEGSGIPGHVCEVYAPRKVAQLSGERAPADREARLVLERSYRPNEGKIPGMWEQFKRINVWDLRVDLQGMCREGPSPHEGSPEHALLLVQFGLSAMIGQSNAKNYPKGNLAGVLVPTGFPVGARQISEGLRQSFDARRVVLLQRRFWEPGAGAAGTGGAAAASAAAQSPSFGGAAVAGGGAASDSGWELFCDLDGTLADFEAGVVEWTGKPPAQQVLSKMWARLLAKPGFFEGLPWMAGAAEMWGDICELMRGVEAARGGDGSLADSSPSGAANPHGEGAVDQESAEQCGGSDEDGDATRRAPRARAFVPPANLAVLTGVPCNAKKHVHREKHKWCERLQGGDIAGQDSRLRVITCMSREKHLHSGPRKILVDDDVDRREGWVAAGGVFIHHVSPARTLYELRRALGALGALPGVRAVREQVARGELPGGRSWSAPAGAPQLEITSVTDAWPALLEPRPAGRPSVVGIDCEWATRRNARFSLSLVQIAVSARHVFVVDLLRAGARVRERLRELLADERVLKVGFALEGDVTRTQLEWRGVVDLQEAGRDLLLASPVEGGTSAVSSSPAAGLRGSNLSLADLARVVLGGAASSLSADGSGRAADGDELVKEKRLQHGDWEVRPLTEEQLRYAALDAAFSLRIYEAFATALGAAALPAKWAYPGKRAGTPLAALLDTMRAAGPALDAALPGGPGPSEGAERPLFRAASAACALELDHELSAHGGVCSEMCSAEDVIYTAVFLAPSARQQLLQIFPPRFPTVHAGHVTLRHRGAGGDAAHLHALPIGSEVNIRVDTEWIATGPGIEAVRVVGLRTAHTDEDLFPFVASGRPHVTLSAAPGTEPAASLELFEQDLGTAQAQGGATVTLRGVVGLVACEHAADELASLQPKVVQRIRRFMEGGDWIAGDTLRFAPGELTSADRKIVHGFAEKNSLESRSDGRTETAKRLILVKKRRQKEQASNAAGEEGGGAQLRVFSGGNEAIDERADAVGGGRKRTRRVTDKSMLRLSEGSAPSTSGTQRAAAASTAGGPTSCSGCHFHGRVLPCGVHASSSEGLVEWDPSVLADGDPIARADVIVLRGLPGAGKSTLSTALRDWYGATVCSADEYFERGAGLSARDLKKLSQEAGSRSHASVYHLVFSEQKVADAHGYCRARFEEALKDRAVADVGKVVVDNVNSKVAHYEKYVAAAERAGLRVAIVELATSTAGAAGPASVGALNSRSVHAVPPAVSHRMHAGWEADERAYRLRLSVEVTGGAAGRPEHSAGERVSESRAPGMSFQAWLSASHLFHYSKSRPSTHLQMAVGARSATFLFVPPRLRAEFLERYARSCADGEWNYLVELVPRPPRGACSAAPAPEFRMFFDLDVPHGYRDPGLDLGLGQPGAGESRSGRMETEACPFVALVRAVQRACGGDRIIVTGFVPEGAGAELERPGLHLRLPDTLVTQARALELRAEVVDALARELGEGPCSPESGVDCASLVDGEVYNSGAGLRMLGSRKVTRAKDRGRAYDVLYVLEADGSVSVGRPRGLSDVQLQELCSVHAPT